MAELYLSQLRGGIRYKFATDSKRSALYRISDDLDYVGNVNMDETGVLVELIQKIIYFRELKKGIAYHLIQYLHELAVALDPEKKADYDPSDISKLMSACAYQNWITNKKHHEEYIYSVLDEEWKRQCRRGDNYGEQVDSWTIKQVSNF